MEYIFEKESSVLELKVAKKIIELAKSAIKEKGHFNMALSGGTSPLGAYKLLAEEPTKCLEWEKINIFWVDERYVAVDEKESNYGQFIQLFSKEILEKMKLFPMYQKGLNCRDAASFYESKMMEHFKSSFPKFDLIILGVGADGHTASLFPGTPLLEEIIRLVKENEAPNYAPVKERISFTYSLINDAKCIMTMLTGESKRAVYESFMSGEKTYPIELVKTEEMILCSDLA
ncbi:MAG: 6-phosphogluconolactonase [Fusobacteria bacterium]|nr:6-phosphogluconolactonase [Fusobacteriota bacterium]